MDNVFWVANEKINFRQKKNTMTNVEIRKLIGQMTLEEKAGMCSGEDFWHTKAIERLGIPSTMLSDGPHGLRKQDVKADHLGINESIKAVCFPTGCGLAASFNRELVMEMGEILGNECPEDPLVASEIAGALIKRVQSKNVGTSIKHFFANNQETRRMSSSSEIDERTMREIYLAAFEGAVKKQKPWTVMCSYNFFAIVCTISLGNCHKNMHI